MQRYHEEKFVVVIGKTWYTLMTKFISLRYCLKKCEAFTRSFFLLLKIEYNKNEETKTAVKNNNAMHNNNNNAFYK